MVGRLEVWEKGMQICKPNLSIIQIICIISRDYAVSNSKSLPNKGLKPLVEKCFDAPQNKI